MSQTNLSNYYTFDLKSNIPCFTEKNLLLVNALIEYNSDYSVTTDKNHPEYKESYAGILDSLKESFFDFSKTENLEKVVKSIDKINSTHLSTHNGIQLTVEKISNIENLKERMKQGDSEIVHDIASAVSDRYNFSFATKFCAYVCEIALGLYDKYCIYDNVVQSVLPLYIHQYAKDTEKPYYKIIHKNRPDRRIESTVSDLRSKDNRNSGEGYKTYRGIIDNIIKGVETKDNIKITYSQFDHLVWYYFKGSEKRIQDHLNTLLT